MKTSIEINKSGIVLYKNQVEVRLGKETVWLSLKQLTELFDRDKSVISRHLLNIFKTKELSKNSVVALFATTAADGKVYQVEHFNLDAIISVGYRVNSRRGTEFRIWATQVLRKHLIDGYTLNERRLKEQAHRLQELQRTIKLIGSIKDRKKIEHKEALGLLDVIGDYSYALGLLDDYDHGRLKISQISKKEKFKISYAIAVKAVRELKKKLSSSALFGQEKDESFKSSIASIYQTFGGKDLYPSIEEKAAHLLYFIVKNHSFVDGNKRIAASIFLWFLERNKILYRADGEKRIADNALVALTLMIAESNPRDKDVISKMLVNLINRKN